MNAYFNNPNRGKPYDYVVCSKLGPCLSICYENPGVCTKCGALTSITPRNQEQIDLGKVIVCHECHFYPGYKPGWQ